ncbi:MAG: c-type cytochrome [Planctomycetes bacterium]|nr:c-type cytochrome [Planctomycetota bacterium]
MPTFKRPATRDDRLQPPSRNGSARRLLLLCSALVLATLCGYEAIERLLLDGVDPELLHVLHLLRWIACCAIAAFLGAILLLRRVLPTPPLAPVSPEPGAVVALQDRLRHPGARRFLLPVLVWSCAAVIVVFLLVVERFATPDQVWREDNASSHLASTEPNGAQLYGQECAVCHGEAGLGDGPASRTLFPQPRDFTKGKYKIRSTRFGDLPTDQDIFDTIRRGMPPSLMPSFAHLSERECWALVAHLKKLASYKTEAGREFRPFELLGQRTVEIAYEAPRTERTIAEGRQVYRKAKCYTCHGDTGAGDGPMAGSLTDDWGERSLPRNFQRGIYKGGGGYRDIYLRCTTGLNGTPMRSYAGVLTCDERWAVAHYVHSLADPKRIGRRSGEESVLVKRSSETLSVNPAARVWDDMAAVEVPLMLTVQRPEAPGHLSLRAAHDGMSIAFLIEWEDPSVDSTLSGTDDYVDGAAIQFCAGRPPGGFVMGEKGRPVNIWFWRMDHQIDTTTYSNTAGTLFQPGRFTSVENLIAEGIGTLTALPAAQQTVQGWGVWVSGRWRVVLLRRMQNGGLGEIQLQPGSAAHAALGVWDGAQKDHGGSKAVTSWQLLEIEK